jgi:hypothetical protein
LSVSPAKVRQDSTYESRQSAFLASAVHAVQNGANLGCSSLAYDANCVVGLEFHALLTMTILS